MLNTQKRPDSTRTASAKENAIALRRQRADKRRPAATYGNSDDAIRAMELLARELNATLVR